MHRLLEQYLDRVASCLWALPAKRREEEMRELRQHLAALAAADPATGDTADNAAQAALRRFGPPEALGRQMARAWWRGRLLGWRDSAVGTALLAGMLLCLPGFLVRVFDADRNVSPGVTLIHTMPLLLTAVWWVLVGVYVGWKLPQRTFAVTASVTMVAAVLSATLPVLRVQTLNFLTTGVFPPLAGCLVNAEFMAQSVLYGLAASALLLAPAAFAGRAWAKRRPA